MASLSGQAISSSFDRLLVLPDGGAHATPTTLVSLKDGDEGNTFALQLATTSIGIGATHKLYLDGGSNTYIVESSADEIDLVCGGDILFSVGNEAGSGDDFVQVPTNTRLVIGGVAGQSSDTYFRENPDDNLQLYVGGAPMMLWDQDSNPMEISVGVNGTGYDVKFFGDTSGSYMLWDQSADKLILNNAYLEGAKIVCENVTADNTLTEAESGKTFIFTDAAAVLTLPDSGGGDLIGVTYKFISYYAGTGQEVKCTDTSNEKMIGALLIADSDDITTAAPSFTAEAGDNYSSVEFTGATEGELGSMFKLTCIATDVWFIEGVVLNAGGSATPFATS